MKTLKTTKTLNLASLLALTAVSGAVVGAQPAQALQLNSPGAAMARPPQPAPALRAAQTPTRTNLPAQRAQIATVPPRMTERREKGTLATKFQTAPDTRKAVNQHANQQPEHTKAVQAAPAARKALAYENDGGTRPSKTVPPPAPQPPSQGAPVTAATAKPVNPGAPGTTAVKPVAAPKPTDPGTPGTKDADSAHKNPHLGSGTQGKPMNLDVPNPAFPSPLPAKNDPNKLPPPPPGGIDEDYPWWKLPGANNLPPPPLQPGGIDGDYPWWKIPGMNARFAPPGGRYHDPSYPGKGVINDKHPVNKTPTNTSPTKPDGATPPPTGGGGDPSTPTTSLPQPGAPGAPVNGGGGGRKACVTDLDSGLTTCQQY